MTNFDLAFKKIEYAVVEAFDADQNETLSVITGLFVILMEQSVQFAGADPSNEILIKNCDGRDITIHRLATVPAAAGGDHAGH